MAHSAAEIAMTLRRPAAEEALRSFAAGRSSFSYGLAKELELLIQALRAAHDEAKASSQAKTAFLASVSHELKTPLTSIIGFAEMIATEQLGPHADPRYADYARDIVAGARRLRDILGDILDMARLENGRMPVQRETLAVADLIEDVLAVLNERAAPNAGSIETAVAGDFPETIWTDRRRLRQALVNLLSNALACTPADGFVRLAARLAESGEAELEVADSGRGMSPGELKRALTRFGHVEEEIRRERAGIGLGLPLARAITELLGGKMRIESAPGQGTTVTLAFPMTALSKASFEWGTAPDRMEERARRLLEESE